MKLSEMNEKIEIHIKSNVTNDMGAIPSFITSDSKICEVWCKVENTFKKTDDGEINIIKNRMKFIIRTRNDIEDDNIILYKNKQYQIEYITELNRTFSVLNTSRVM